MGKAKLNIPMCAALVLLFLTLVSIHMTSGLYARYVATASGEDSARVAKFDVVTSLENPDVTIDCATGTTGQYVIKVKNNSEVAVNYTLFVKLTPNNSGSKLDATDLTVSIADEKDTNGNYIFKDAYFSNEMKFTRDTPLAPGGEREHCLKLVVSDWGTISKDADNVKTLTREFDVTVDIQVTQVD